MNPSLTHGAAATDLAHGHAGRERHARPLLADCHRCAAKLGRNLSSLVSDATSCAFHLIRTMHDDGGPRNRRRLRAEPIVIYGTASTASAPGVRVAGPETVRSCAGAQGARSSRANMVIERDLQITIDDELVRRADVYRPKTDAPVSVIMTLAPYRQGRESTRTTTRRFGTG